jgi:hypothetical protein
MFTAAHRREEGSLAGVVCNETWMAGLLESRRGRHGACIKLNTFHGIGCIMTYDACTTCVRCESQTGSSAAAAARLFRYPVTALHRPAHGRCSLQSGSTVCVSLVRGWQRWRMCRKVILAAA